MVIVFATVAVLTVAVVIVTDLGNNGDIIEVDAGPVECGEKLYYEFNEETGELIITGSGDMENFLTTGPWGREITSVVLPEGLTSIGNNAFKECELLTSITIPDSVTSIGDKAFSRCKGLISVTTPGAVTSHQNSIGEEAFAGCTGLKSITIGGGTSIGDYAFMNCKALTSVTILDSDIDVSIGTGAFIACIALNSIIIPDSVKSIKDQAFTLCKSLTSITIPKSVSSIEDKTFWQCSALTTAIIPDSVTSIGVNAFWKCSALTSITIPKSVTSIKDYAFRSCLALTSVIIPDSVTSIGKGAFAECNNLKSVVFGSGLNSIHLTDGKNSNSFGDRDFWSGPIESYDSKKLTTPEELRNSTFKQDSRHEYLMIKVPAHSVTYDPAGGVGAVPEQRDVAEGFSFTVKDYTGTKAGYTFGGWSWNGTVYKAGQSIEMGKSDITLTAVWELDTVNCTVTFDPNGGIWSGASSVSCPQGTKITISSDEPTRESYAFKGWSSGGRTFPAGAEITVNSDMVLKAEWALKVIPLPITPGGSDPESEDTVMPYIVPEEREEIQSKDGGKSLPIIAVIAVIIAELAILCIVRKR